MTPIKVKNIAPLIAENTGDIALKIKDTEINIEGNKKDLIKEFGEYNVLEIGVDDYFGEGILLIVEKLK